jgi:hypothetical protein
MVPEDCEENPELPLSGFIRVRKDSAECGFVHNLQNDLVLYADSEALAVIESRLGQPLSALQQSEPWLVKALCLAAT